MNKQMTSGLAQGDNTPVVLNGISSNETLIAKEVEFLGDSLLVVKDEAKNKLYTGVGYVCKGIGLTRDQTKNERKRIQEDVVLSKGGRNLTLLTKGGNQEVICIELDYLPLWLAKISITPKMKEQQPELVNRLVEYQLKVKDVLANAFIHKEYPIKAKSQSVDTKEKEIEARLINAKVRQAGAWLKIAEKVNIPTYKDICYSKATEALNGEALLPLPKAERKSYSAAEIGEKLGITAHKVGLIANKHNLKTEEYGLMVWDKSQYSSKQVETWRYYENVIPVIKQLIEEQKGA